MQFHLIMVSFSVADPGEVAPKGPPIFFFDFFFFLQLAFTERVVPATQTFDWSIDDRC